MCDVDRDACHNAYHNHAHQQAHHGALLAAIGDPGGSVCDVGCGYGAFSDLLPEGVEYLGVDRNPEKIMEASQLRPERRFLVSGRPRPADTVVFCGFAPIYVPKPHRFLAECWKVARRTLAVSGDSSTLVEAMLRVCPGQPEVAEHEGDWPPFWTMVVRR